MEDNLEEKLAITKDGTLDWSGKPAIKCKTGGWFSSPCILGSQMFAAIGFGGVSTNLYFYIINILHEGNAAAATSVSNWLGTSYITSLIGGFLADSYWGGYWTSAVFLVIYLLGMVFLTISATVSKLQEQRAVFYTAVYTVAFGCGGYRPCISAFGANQFDNEDPEEQTQSTIFFNWSYMSIMLGTVISATLLVYIEDNINWGLGFGLSTGAAALSFISFFTGSSVYRYQKPAGNPITRITQVLFAACSKFNIKAPSDSSLLHEVASKDSAIKGSRKIQHTDTFRFLDKAAVVTDSKEVNTWTVCTVTQVEEVKSILRLLPIWSTSIFSWALYTQVSTLFIQQGAAMNTEIGSFKIPAASLSSFCTLSVIICGLAYEWFIVPFARKFTGNEQGLTNLQRIGIGLVAVTGSMASAAVVEIFRLKSAAKQNVVQISVFWQLPQYFLVGASEAFAYVGQLDFFYDQSPDALKGIGVALSQCSFALGNYLSGLLITLVVKLTSRGNKMGWIPDDLNKGHLDYYFWLLSGLSVVNLVVYLVCAVHYKCIKINKDLPH